jgi:Zn ribbon nucleic-acid-binding protein
VLHQIRKFKCIVACSECKLCGHHAITIPAIRPFGHTWDGKEVTITERVCVACAMELKRELTSAPEDVEVSEPVHAF